MNDTADRRKLRSDVIYDAVIFIADNVGALIRLGLVPMLGAFLGSYLVAFVYSGAAISRILYSLAGVIFAVGVHRMIIGGRNPDWVIFRLGRHELAYAGVVLLYILVASSAHYFSYVIAWISGVSVGTTVHGVEYKTPVTPALAIVGGLATWLFLWGLLRLILVFPYAAMTGEISFSPSWNAMRGNIWRLLKTTFLFPPAHIRGRLYAVGFCALVVGLLSAATSGQIQLLFQAICSGMVIAAGAAISSYAYKDLLHETADGDDVQPQPLWFISPQA